MDYLDEINKDIISVDPKIISTIRLLERVHLFEKLRTLIHQKENENDQAAAAILGWAYERLAD